MPSSVGMILANKSHRIGEEAEKYWEKKYRANMKNIRNGICAAVALVSLGASPAMALQVRLYAGYAGPDPGKYQAVALDGLEYVLNNYATTRLTSDGKAFGTFCLEATEYFVSGKTYVAALNNGAVNGGNGAVDGKDIISKGTAYLYEQFALGNTLAGNDWNRLQNWIWYLEGEITSLSTLSALTSALTSAGFSSVAAAKQNYEGTAVMVMNLTDPNGRDGLYGTRRQDQLVYVGTPGGGAPPVPDGGATLMLMGIALVGMAALRRKSLR